MQSSEYLKQKIDMVAKKYQVVVRGYNAIVKKLKLSSAMERKLFNQIDALNKQISKIGLDPQRRHILINKRTVIENRIIQLQRQIMIMLGHKI